MKVTDLQIMIITTMYKHGPRREFSAVDISNRGCWDTSFGGLGNSMKGLVKKGLLELTTLPRAAGSRKAKYTLTKEGQDLAKGFIELAK